MGNEKKRHAGGRPTKYRPEYCKRIIEYFSVPPHEIVKKEITNPNGTKTTITKKQVNDLPFFGGFARSIGINHETILEWADKHPEFADAYHDAKELQKEFLVKNALNQNFNAYFSTFTAKNILGWRDQVDHEVSGKNGGPVRVDSNVSANISGLSIEALQALAALNE